MVNDLLLQHYINGSFGVPIALPNHTFDPTGMAMWAKWQIMPIRDRMGTLCDVEHTGLLQITLFVPTGSKETAIRDKANAIVTHFGTEKSHFINGVQVMIMSSTAETAMADGKWFMNPISIEYRIL